MIDIVHFKGVYDKYGNVIGDPVIRGLANLLRRGVLDRERRVARFVGEQVAVLLSGTSVGEAVQPADVVRRHANTMEIRDRRTQQVMVRMTIAARVATLHGDDHLEAWIARANEALCRSKLNGGKRVSQ